MRVKECLVSQLTPYEKRKLSFKSYRCSWCNQPIFNDSAIIMVSGKVGREVCYNFYHWRCRDEQIKQEASE